MRLAELIRKDGGPYPLTSQMVNVWVDVFERENITQAQVEAAFRKAEVQCKFWPSPSEVLGFVTAAEGNAAELEAAQKWTQVLDYIRLHWHADIPPKNAPRISERTQQAINAAGGLAYIADCEPEPKQWARKRFIESYIVYGEPRQEQFLLPDGETKSLIAASAQAKALPSSTSFEQLHERGLAYAREIGAAKPERILPTAAEPPRVVDVEGRIKELARQAELIKTKYAKPGLEAH
jgi:hypothetical protein